MLLKSFNGFNAFLSIISSIKYLFESFLLKLFSTSIKSRSKYFKNKFNNFSFGNISFKKKELMNKYKK